MGRSLVDKAVKVEEKGPDLKPAAAFAGTVSPLGGPLAFPDDSGGFSWLFETAGGLRT